MSKIPVAKPLQRHFAICLGHAAGPSGTLRSWHSVQAAFVALRRFAAVLAEDERPPQTAADLRPRHLISFRLAENEPRREQALKGLLRRHLEGYTDAFIAILRTTAPPRQQNFKRRYSDAEIRRIMRAARRDVRAARDRIRRGQGDLDRWRRGLIDPGSKDWQWGSLLQHVATTGDVPRKMEGRPRVDEKWLRPAGNPSVREVFGALFLDLRDVVALQILLVALTGQNVGTVSRAPAAHHRTDGERSPSRVAVVELLKPRRPNSTARMLVPVTDVPPWVPTAAGAPPEARELASPFGVYLLAVELGALARALSGSDRLFTWRAVKGGGGVGGGFRTRPPADEHRPWSASHDLRDDSGQPLVVDFNRLRLSFLQAHDTPVAHSKATLRGEYQVRDQGDLLRYQQVVARTLEERVQEARDTMALTHMGPEDIEEARRAPGAVAQRLGIDQRTLDRVLSGRLDTVLAACSDNTNGPINPGKSCEASFLMCTACPCAISLPRHLVIQVAAHDALLARRGVMEPLLWAERFGAPWARLANLINQFSADALARARAGISQEDQVLVERLLTGELDA